MHPYLPLHAAGYLVGDTGSHCGYTILARSKSLPLRRDQFKRQDFLSAELSSAEHPQQMACLAILSYQVCMRLLLQTPSALLFISWFPLPERN